MQCHNAVSCIIILLDSIYSITINPITPKVLHAPQDNFLRQCQTPEQMYMRHISLGIIILRVEIIISLMNYFLPQSVIRPSYNISNLVACNLNSRTIFSATDLSATKSVAGVCQEDGFPSWVYAHVKPWNASLLGSAFLDSLVSSA